MKIALIGKFRTGKDTVADYLVKYHNFQKFSFASGINKVAEMLFPEESKGGKNRKLLKDIGQGMRKVKNDVWINHCFREISKKGCCPNIVISDMRQMDELQAAAKRNFIFIKVITSKEQQIKRSKKKGDNFNIDDLDDETEKMTEKLPADYLLLNDGSLRELYSQIERTLDHIKQNS